MRFPLRWTAVRASSARAVQPTGCVTFPAAEREDLLRATYEAFNARDIDVVLRLMTADVDWPNAWEGLIPSGSEWSADEETREGSVAPVTRKISL